MRISIQELMERTGVKFGTSGARGLVVQMTDRVCYAYTRGFLQYLESAGELPTRGGEVAVAGDLRPSTNRIMLAVLRAAADAGYRPVDCGTIPSPALALHGLEHRAPAIMVTGSHIPDDRNGIKFNKCSGEVLKADEAGIRAQAIDLDPAQFTAEGAFASPTAGEFPTQPTAGRAYIDRYLRFFPAGCLAGARLGVYQHSAVGRDALVEIFRALGADVLPLGRSDTFIPVDTEAIRPEDSALARQWAAEHRLDAVISTDGDSDRPLISDERGEWLRGDVAGILCARYLEADSVSTPVSCNSAVEKCGWFREVRRTRIGSPFVVSSMLEATAAGARCVVGYEANGGFLLNSDVVRQGRRLRALPTRDAVILLASVLLLARESGKTISALLAELPPRHTVSGLLRDCPVERSQAILDRFSTGELARDTAAATAAFGDLCGSVRTIDRTDGIRFTFTNDEVVHLRPSGNAPEFRCYTEADSARRAQTLNDACLEIIRRLATD